MMAFRSGSLITSGLAATFPVWQWIDPLPILESSKNKSDGQKFPEYTDPNAKSPSTEKSGIAYFLNELGPSWNWLPRWCAVAMPHPCRGDSPTVFPD